MIINAIKNAWTRRCERKDAEYYAEMEKKVANVTDMELKTLNSDYHYGIDMDRRMGVKVSDVVLKVDNLIENEMNKRGLKSCDELEEEIWFSQRGHCIERKS